MSTLKSINWALAWRRAIWTAFFAAFYGIVIYMAKDMAGTQPVIFGIILLAALVCAVAFVYSRDNREALLIAVLALCVHAFLEASYWSSVIDDTSTHAMREQSAAASRDVVNEKRRARYASSASGKGAGQLSAEVEMLKQDARWVTSAQCTNATAPASRAFCQEYYRLMADLAAAKEAANLENTVFHTTVEAVDIPRNLAKGALWLSDVTGMSVNAATNILVALMVLFIQAGLAFSLRIGWQPQEARTAAKAFAPISVASAPVQPVLAPRSPMVALEKMTGVKAPEVRPAEHSEKFASPNIEPAEVFPDARINPPPADPTGPGTPIAKPEAPKEEVADTNVAQFPLKPRQETNAQYRIAREPDPKHRKEKAETKDFIREVLGIDKEALTAMKTAIRERKPLDERVADRLMNSPDLYEIYDDHCDQLGLSAKSPKAFSGEVWDALGLPKGTRKMKGVSGIRNKKGMRFPVFAQQAMQVKRSA